MVLLPKLIFVFLNAFLDITVKTLQKIQSILNTFVWVSKNPRMKLLTTEKEFRNGGIGIQTSENTEASILTACIEWWRMADEDPIRTRKASHATI